MSLRYSTSAIPNRPGVSKGPSQSIQRRIQRQQRVESSPRMSYPEEEDDALTVDQLRRSASTPKITRTRLMTSDQLQSWSEIALKHKNAVVKILCASVVFDWARPFRQASDESSIGSGFFVSKSGLIVTNAHVVTSATRVWFTVPSEGEKRFDADVVGICFDLDIALLQCTNESLLPIEHHLTMGDSDQTKFGEEVMTLGYPLGMNSLKLTVGIISGRQDGMFQTDAPLNPGNSGGPMLNRKGNVVGINVAIIEQSQNVGFAIPVHHLLGIFDFLRTRPENNRILHKPILGADLCNASESLHRFIGNKSLESDNDQPDSIPLWEGVYISNVYEGFPIHRAGVRGGDILHSFNGHSLDNYGQAKVPYSPYARVELAELMDDMTHESKPVIIYSRKGERHTTTIDFRDPKNPDLPVLPVIRHRFYPYETIDFELFAGLVVMPLCLNHLEDSSLVMEFGQSSAINDLLPIATNLSKQLKPSLIISSIFAGSLLQKIDSVNVGSILESVNGKKVSTLEEFRAALLEPVKQPETGELFLEITTSSKEVVVLPLQETLLEEPTLATSHMFNMSEITIQLAEKFFPDMATSLKEERDAAAETFLNRKGLAALLQGLGLEDQDLEFVPGDSEDSQYEDF